MCSIAVLALALGRTAWSQTLPAPTVYAITGARIEIGDGNVIEKGTVVVRDGVITAVGAQVTVPPDAEIIKGDGLVVYPGFIDGHATAGVKPPPAQVNQDDPPEIGSVVLTAMREANRKGVRPEMRSVEYLDMTDAGVASARKAGFTTQLLLPTGGMMNGIGGVVNISGAPRRDCVVLADSVEGFGFSAGERSFAAGNYPGSLLGIFAQIRQTLLDAQRYQLLVSARDHGASVRVPDDDVLKSLQPVLSGKLPVLFVANSANEIVRSVKLADEFRFRPIIDGGLYAYKQAALLAQRHIPVIVSLNFGTEPGTKPPSTPGGGGPGRGRGGRGRGNPNGGPSGGAPPNGAPPGAPPDGGPPPAPGGGTATAPRPEEEPDDNPKAALAERKRLWNEEVGNAAALYKAGVPIAFSTYELRNLPDFWTNLRLAVKAGLPKAAALAALTSQAAQILNVQSQLGSIRVGKAAALTVMSGDFLEPASTVKYLIIDRVKVDPSVTAGPSGPPTRGFGRPVDDDGNESEQQP
jgi:imidazolonepropionase-like amidohydrolase